MAVPKATFLVVQVAIQAWQKEPRHWSPTHLTDLALRTTSGEFISLSLNLLFWKWGHSDLIFGVVVRTCAWQRLALRELPSSSPQSSRLPPH